MEDESIFGGTSGLSREAREVLRIQEQQLRERNAKLIAGTALPETTIINDITES